MTEVSTRTGLHRIVYFSAFSSRFAAATTDREEQIKAIVSASIRNNRERAITGLLLSHQQWFVQALEGPAEAVMTTYGRILHDPRHMDANIIGAGPAESRQFANWNMCARRLSDTDDAILRTLDLKGAFDPAVLSLGKAMSLLTAVKAIQAQASAGSALASV